MILETIRELSREQKEILTAELLDDLNAPEIASGTEDAIETVLSARFEAYLSGDDIASAWSDVRKRLQSETGVKWQR